MFQFFPMAPWAHNHPHPAPEKIRALDVRLLGSFFASCNRTCAPPTQSPPLCSA